MRITVTLVFSFLLLGLMSTDVLVAAAPVDFRSGQPYDQFILFGDSITEFSSDLTLDFCVDPALQNDYVRRLDVINRGFSGYNTSQAIEVFPEFFPSPNIARIRFITIFFGANDAVLPPFDQYVPLDQFKENLKAIVQHPAMRAQNPRILLLSPPPVNEYQLALNSTVITRTANNTKLYADASREVANSLQVPFVDIWTAFMTAAGWTEGQPLAGSKDIPENSGLKNLLTDGLHFTGVGYEIMYDEIMKVIRATWPDQAPENLPMVFPAWQDLPK